MFAQPIPSKVYTTLTLTSFPTKYLLHKFLLFLISLNWAQNWMLFYLKKTSIFCFPAHKSVRKLKQYILRAFRCFLQMIDVWFEFFFFFLKKNQFWLISAFFKHNSPFPNFLTNSHAWKISHHTVPDWITSLTHFKLVRVWVFWPQRPTKSFFKYKWHELCHYLTPSWLLIYFLWLARH